MRPLVGLRLPREETKGFINWLDTPQKSAEVTNHVEFYSKLTKTILSKRPGKCIETTLWYPKSIEEPS